MALLLSSGRWESRVLKLVMSHRLRSQPQSMAPLVLVNLVPLSHTVAARRHVGDKAAADQRDGNGAAWEWKSQWERLQMANGMRSRTESQWAPINISARTKWKRLTFEFRSRSEASPSQVRCLLTTNLSQPASDKSWLGPGRLKREQIDLGAHSRVYLAQIARFTTTIKP